MRRDVAFLIGLAAFVAACVGYDKSTAPSVRRAGVLSYLDCQMTPTECGKIAAGINWLWTPTISPYCWEAAALANDRYMASSGTMGYKKDPYMPGPTMSVADPNNPGQYITVDLPAAYLGDDGYVYVAGWFLDDPRSSDQMIMGGLLAHEDWGHFYMGDPSDHTSGWSYWIQSLCNHE